MCGNESRRKQVALLQPKCLKKKKNHHAPRFLVGLTKSPGNVRAGDDNNVMGPSTDAMIVNFFFFFLLCSITQTQKLFYFAQTSLSFSLLNLIQIIYNNLKEKKRLYALCSQPKTQRRNKNPPSFCKDAFLFESFSALYLSLNECFTPSSSLSFGDSKFVLPLPSSEDLHFC